MTTKSLSALRKEFKDKKKELDAISSQISTRLKQTLVACFNCQKGYQIQQLQYIQTLWLDKGQGYESDEWRHGEGQWKCPSCQNINRLDQQPDIVELKHHFKSCVDEKVKQ